MGSIIPPPGCEPACAQVYVLDPQEQLASRKRLSWGSRLNDELLVELATMLQLENPFVNVVQQAAQRDDPSFVMFVEGTSHHSRDRRRYNRPTQEI